MGATMSRPRLGKHDSRSSRSMTRFARRKAAWDLAHLVNDEVSEEAFEKAYGLLQRCINFAIADSRMDETETAENWNNPHRIRKQEQLSKRMGKLNAELHEYGCKLVRPWSCYDVYEYDFENHMPKGSGYLNFF